MDLWILEIGLGGRLDAVNIIDPDVSLITSIGLDHQAYLGDSLEAIASEKAGVMRHGIQTFSAASNVRHTLQIESQRYGAQLSWLDEAFDGRTVALPVCGLMLDVTGVYLPKPSVALACLAMDALGHITSQLQEDVLNQAVMMGRMSRHQIGGRNYILDVGHNSLACEFVTRSLRPVIPRSRRVVIFGALGDKDIDSMLPILRAYSGRVALVGVEGSRGRTVDALETSWSLLFGQTYWRSFATLTCAMRELPSELNLDDHVLIIGSFVLVADALKHDLFN